MKKIKGIKIILIAGFFVSAVLTVAFFGQKNMNYKKEPSQPTQKEVVQQNQEQTKEEILSPKEVIKKYIEADIIGKGMGFGHNEVSQFFTYSDGSHTSFIFAEVYFSVIKKYEIVSESQPTDNNNHYVKVNFYCDKIISHEVVGLKSEKGIKASAVSGGEPAFFIEDCSEYFKEINSDCLNERKQTNDNSSYNVFDCNNNIETVNFELVKDGNAWKINGPGGSDHVSIDFFNKWLKE